MNQGAVLSESSESIPAPPVAAAAAAPQDESTSIPPSSAYPSGPGAGQVPGAGYPPNAGYTPYQSYGYPYPMMPMPQQELPKGMAIAAMVLGIVGLCTSIFYIGGVIGIVGLVFSIIALRSANRGRTGGRGMAIAGLVTSIIAIVVNTIEIIVIVWFVHTAVNCAQYEPTTYPNSGSQSQYDACMRQGILGN
jgi:hypothetical protein